MPWSCLFLLGPVALQRPGDRGHRTTTGPLPRARDAGRKRRCGRYRERQRGEQDLGQVFPAIERTKKIISTVTGFGAEKLMGTQARTQQPYRLDLLRLYAPRYSLAQGRPEC